MAQDLAFRKKLSSLISTQLHSPYNSYEQQTEPTETNFTTVDRVTELTPSQAERGERVKVTSRRSRRGCETNKKTQILSKDSNYKEDAIRQKQRMNTFRFDCKALVKVTKCRVRPRLCGFLRKNGRVNQSYRQIGDTNHENTTNALD